MRITDVKQRTDEFEVWLPESKINLKAHASADNKLRLKLFSWISSLESFVG